MSEQSQNIINTYGLNIDGRKTIDVSGNIYVKTINTCYSNNNSTNSKIIIDEQQNAFITSVNINNKLFVDKFKNVFASNIQSNSLNTALIKINGRLFVDGNMNLNINNINCKQINTNGHSLYCGNIDTNLGSINCGYINTGYYGIDCNGLNAKYIPTYGDSSGQTVYSAINCGDINTHSHAIDAGTITATSIIGESIAAMQFDLSGNFLGFGQGTFDTLITKNIDISGNVLISDHSGGYIWNQIAQQGYDLSGNLYYNGSSFINMNKGYLNFSNSEQGSLVSKSIWLTEALNMNTSFIVDGSGNTRCNNLHSTGNILMGDLSGGYVWNTEAKQNFESTGNPIGENSAFIDVNNGYLNFGQSNIGGIVGKNILALDYFSVGGMNFQVDGSGNVISRNMHTADIDCHGGFVCHQNIVANSVTCNSSLTVGFTSNYFDTSGETIYMPASMGNLMIGDLSGGYIWNKEARDAIDLSGNLHAENSAFINMHYGDINFEKSRVGRIMGKYLHATEDIYVNNQFHVDISGNVVCNDFQADPITDSSGGFKIGSYLINGNQKGYVSIPPDMRFNIPVGESRSSSNSYITSWNSSSVAGILNEYFTGSSSISPPSGTTWIDTHLMLTASPALYVYLVGPSGTTPGWFSTQLQRTGTA